jgi:hypothetical protein
MATLDEDRVRNAYESIRKEGGNNWYLCFHFVFLACFFLFLVCFVFSRCARLLLGYDAAKKNHIVLVAEGQGGVSELAGHLADDKNLFAYFRYVSPPARFARFAHAVR